MNRGTAFATGLALAAGLSAACEAVPSSPETHSAAPAPVDYVVPEQVDRVDIKFVQIPGSEISTPAQQEETVAKVASAFTVWQTTSRGALLPKLPEVVNGGERQLDATVGKAVDVCDDITRQQLSTKVLDKLRSEESLDDSTLRVVVLRGTWKHCSGSKLREIAAEARIGSRELVAYDGIGSELTAHETGHAVFKLNDSLAYNCSTGGIGEPFPAPVVVTPDCTLASHQDFNTVMSGHSSSMNDHDRLSGPEMYRLNLIKPEEVAKLETPGTAEFALDAIFNPDQPGQTKLISVPLAEVAGYPTVFKTRTDSLMIELSGKPLRVDDCGKFTCPDVPEDLSVKVYMADKDSIRKDVDGNGNTPQFPQLYLSHFGSSENSDQAGEQIVIQGEEGTLTIDIEDLKVTTPAQGQAKLKVSLVSKS